MSVLSVFLGIAVLLALLGDVFFTVFRPHGRGGWLNQVQNRSVWALFRATGCRADGTARDGWLSLAGPILVVLTLVVWVALLVAGFALIYYPWSPAFLVSPGHLRAPWAETLYYSGYTAATLGFGDVVADHEALRLLAPLQAFLGFAMLSISVTYISSLYRNLLDMRALAANVGGYFSDGTEPTLRTAATAQTRGFAQWADGITTSVLQTIQAHMQYPILHYFRPTSAQDSLPLQLRHLLAVRRRVRTEEPAEATAFASDLAVRSLAGSVERYLEMVDRYFVPAGFAAEAPPQPGDAVERAHRRLLRYMCYH